MVIIDWFESICQFAFTDVHGNALEKKCASMNDKTNALTLIEQADEQLLEKELAIWTQLLATQDEIFTRANRISAHKITVENALLEPDVDYKSRLENIQALFCEFSTLANIEFEQLLAQQKELTAALQKLKDNKLELVTTFSKSNSLLNKMR